MLQENHALKWINWDTYEKNDFKETTIDKLTISTSYMFRFVALVSDNMTGYEGTEVPFTYCNTTCAGKVHCLTYCIFIYNPIQLKRNLSNRQYFFRN